MKTIRQGDVLLVKVQALPEAILALVGAIHGPFQRPKSDQESVPLFGLSVGIASVVVARWFA